MAKVLALKPQPKPERRPKAYFTRLESLTGSEWTDIRDPCGIRHIEALSDKRLEVEDRLRQSPNPGNPTEPESR
jgi:hypothetical protein